MKFVLPASLAVVAFVAPALALERPAEVYITSELRADRYIPDDSACEVSQTPEAVVTGLQVYPLVENDIACDFYKELDCQGDKWTIKVSKGDTDGKQQKFSKPFYVGSLACAQTA